MTAVNRKSHLSPQLRRLIIVGVGGTGSFLAQGLAKMISGYSLQLEVLLVDPDIVEEKNCARQNFLAYEIGQPKAEALAFRLNQQYGISFAAIVGKGEDHLDYAKGNSWQVRNQDFVKGKSLTSKHDFGRLVVTCVDSLEARKPYKDIGPWLDLGNGLETGQAIYGVTDDRQEVNREWQTWEKSPQVANLPNAWIVANLAKVKKPRKRAPSCADTPFAEQGVFANEWAAAAGLTILHQLLVKGELTTPAIYFDTAKGRMTPAFITKDYLKGA